MGCICTKSQPSRAAAGDTQYPKYDKVWRSYDHRTGYKCTLCGESAKFYDHVSLNCQPSEYIVKNNQWHRHCAHNIKVPVVCSIGHTTMQILNTGCECGWRNQTDFSSDSDSDDSDSSDDDVFKPYRIPLI